MRIQKLYLDAFGPFTDCSIDLLSGKEGLHIVYGPNEAGKSSALRAISQLLYGIPSRSADNFIHPNNMMCIGGSISDGERTLNINRRKGNKGTIRNRENDEVLDDSILDVILGGMDQETFKIVFGLSHNNLVQGGRDIVEGKGNVGEALFAASAGLGNLSQVKGNLIKEAEELFKPSGSKPFINAGLSKLGEVRKNLKTSQLRTGDWSEKDKELHLSIESRDTIEILIRETKAEKNRLKRILDASPLVTKYFEVIEHLKPVANAQIVPNDFDEKFRTLLKNKAQVLGKIQSANEESIRCEESLEKLSINEAVLIQEKEIEFLNNLYATNTKALNDSRENLEPKLHLLEKQAIEALELFRHGVSLDKIPTFRIKPQLRSRITDLGQKSELVKNRIEDAEISLEKLKNTRNGIVTSLDKLDLVVETVELEKAIQRVCKSGDIEERLREKQKEAIVTKGDISAGIAQLELWNGTMEELETMKAPSSETIERFRNEYEQLEVQLKALQKLQDDTKNEYTKIEDQITALKQEHDVPSEILLAEYRNSRNSCWHIVRKEWENSHPPGIIQSENVRKALSELGMHEETMGNLADAYETITRETDDVSDRLRGEAERVAKLVQLEANKTSHQKKIDDLVLKCNDIENEYKRYNQTWNELWKPLGIEPRSPKEMSQWARKQKELVTCIGAFRTVIAEADKLKSTILNNRNELSSSLVSLGESGSRDEESLAALIDRAESIVSSCKKTSNERTQLNKKLESLDANEIPESERRIAESKEKLTVWRNEWAEAMNALGEDITISPGEANAIVQQIDTLTALYGQIEEFKIRIDQIDKDDRHFRNKARELAKTVAMDTVEMSEEQTSQKLYNELKNNRLSKSQFDSIKKQSAQTAKKIGDSRDELNRIEEYFASLCHEAQVINPDDLEIAWKRSVDRLKYEKEIDSIKEQLISLSPSSGISEFIEKVKSENIDAIEPALSQLDEKITIHEDESKVLSEKIGSISKELAQMDGSGAAAQFEEDIQSVLADISTNIQQYARLKISEIVLTRAIEQYRVKNQGPLLYRAGEIFSVLTLGSYEGLRTDFGDNDEDILVGIRSGGKVSVKVPFMSEGTADQLYLALRMASLEKFMKNHPPIPFILDDILVNFDNERAAATLKVLAEFSQHTQIIFFTHHRHIIDIAQESIDENVLYMHNL